ncbi:Predicted acetyltransferase, GNAT family [Aliiroseovarius halocynthiae]|uniref:GNAT family N-acetyltransferase n=1 Tax=Aliiroseovarius halocynthiae TaxID=985055 RepID=A0A545SXW3_9RHOB|nr:GNAT family N-acetyltransferase [Aliiroseovarius halocynthiae]TQV69801.1 GNAT family N-acetyltransferase [Aliiroseovarius halocynthiae]SMR81732.1 Predicted acetyltransferase, GNAT family [Aliiroseovarius halocynthiae]
MIRRARPGDEVAIEVFLANHAETSMFLRSNLIECGLEGGESPRATTYWICESEQGIRAVFGRSNAGFLMMQAPDACQRDWLAFRDCIAGQSILGITGDAPQVAFGRAFLQLEAKDFALDDAEPLYRLPLDGLIVPVGQSHTRPPVEADREMLEIWHRDYISELRMSTPSRMDAEAKERAERSISAGQTRLLIQDGQPVAMTAFNSRLPDMVQIGAVYTPPTLRSYGYARRAVALHLDEVRAEGVQTAILFASGEPACRAYEAIGFERIGAYHLAILKEPIILEAA